MSSCIPSLITQRGPLHGQRDAPKQDFLWYLVLGGGAERMHEGIYIDWELAESRCKAMNSNHVKGYCEVEALLDKWRFVCAEEHKHPSSLTIPKDHHGFWVLRSHLQEAVGLPTPVIDLDDSEDPSVSSESSFDSYLDGSEHLFPSTPIQQPASAATSRPSPAIDPKLLVQHAAPNPHLSSGTKKSRSISPQKKVHLVVPCASTSKRVGFDVHVVLFHGNCFIFTDPKRAKDKFLEAAGNGFEVEMMISKDMDEAMDFYSG
ncbi:hypothetical protein VKT23_016666 [Stygiomarasmius scandens]|uniref:Uncharacterized protein n=1 Tax=Marasmiellus scandens TaxID=2682957 RepID=A0ABR1IYK5_9AGAR